MTELWKSFSGIYLEMAPYLFIGLTFAGLMHVFLKGDFVVKQLGKRNFWSIVKASVLGVPLPLCSCGVVPTAMHLKRKGASSGATVSFLTSTPQTGIDSIIPTFGMLGWFMGIYRPVTALITGILTGVAVNGIKDGEDRLVIEEKAQACCLICDCDDPNCTHPSHPWNRVESSPEAGCSCESGGSCCGGAAHGSNQSNASEKSSGIFKKFINYAYGDFLDDISTQVVIGILIAGLITWLIPDGFFEQYGGNGLLGMIFMIIVGLPMYVCATGSIPIAVSLIMKGISPGAAFVFLVVGPATNAASMTVIASSLGKKVMAVYLGVLTLSALLFGLLLNLLLETTGMEISLNHGSHAMGRSILLDIITVIFSFALLMSLWRRYRPRREEKEQKEDAGRMKFVIDDMHCNHCVKAITQAVQELSGVDDIRIELASRTLLVTGMAEREEVVQAVKALGYKIVEV